MLYLFFACFLHSKTVTTANSTTTQADAIVIIPSCKMEWVGGWWESQAQLAWLSEY